MNYLFSRISVSCVAALMFLCASNLPAADKRPNIIVILADDMGFSDLGCYGGELKTPNLDKLAGEGLRFTQFYNTARCCPTRASLLTGLYPHQAGVGHMIRNTGHPGYTVGISTNTATMAEVLKGSGYGTYMVGKWHIARSGAANKQKADWPMQRGFDKYYGTIAGSGSHWDPSTLCRGNTFITPENDPEYKTEKFYYADALTDNAIAFVSDHKKQSPDKPFFMYMAYTAAHWPLHAPEDEIEKVRGQYDAGYEPIRAARFKRVKELGLVPDDMTSAPTVGDWSAVKNKEWQARCMEVYAAMVHRLDTGVGRVVESLREQGELDNTLIFFLQDNGACAENLFRTSQAPYKEDYKPFGKDDLQTKSSPPMQTRDGRPVKTGQDVMPGGPDSYVAYGEDWANVSNTPFREYKHWVHEGGISTPLIVHWPKGVSEALNGKLVRDPGHLIDIMATCVDVAAAKYPSSVKGHKIPPMEGKSLRPAFQAKAIDREQPLFWEHEGNRAVRKGKWKLVAKSDQPWELYNIDVDRAEQNDLIAKEPKLAKELAAEWDKYAARAQVLPLGGWKDNADKAGGSTTGSVKLTLKPKDKFDADNSPSIRDRAITVEVTINKWGKDGVLVSHGGAKQGYSLYMKENVPHFTVRAGDAVATIKADSSVPETTKVIKAELSSNGSMHIDADEKTVATGKASRLVADDPADSLVIGNDVKGACGDYETDFPYTGKIKSVVLSLGAVEKTLGM